MSHHILEEEKTQEEVAKSTNNDCSVIDVNTGGVELDELTTCINDKSESSALVSKSGKVPDNTYRNFGKNWVFFIKGNEPFITIGPHCKDLRN